MLKITEDISYAALFKNNAKVGDIVQLEGAMDFIIFSASIDNSSFMSLLQGSTSDINTYIAYYDDSTQLYIFDEDSSLSIANNNNINSIVRSYVEDTYITEKTLEKLPAGTNASITATDSILNAFAKLQGQVNAKANTSSIPTAATVTPKASGTAAVGTSTKYAREDHVHPLQTNVETATKLAKPRVIAIAGAVSGSATFDGSSNVSIYSTLNGFDASKITSGTLNADRLPEIPISKIPAAARILSTATLSSSTVSAGYSYNNTSSRTISSLSGFSSSNPDSVIISTAKLTFTASNAIKMDGLADLSGTYYIYCLSYMANGKIAVNGAVYA